MHKPTLRHAARLTGHLLMYLAWFGVTLWSLGVVFYNVWGGMVLE